MIRFLLFFGMDWAERHPGAMFAALLLLICLAGAIDPSAPQL
jgi:hypothetical protein